MNARRTIPTAAALALLAATGCGGDSAGGEELTVFANATDRASMDAVVAAFEEDNDVAVTATYADTDEFQSTLRTQLTSGTAPDVFTVWPGNGNPAALQVLQPDGYIADLSDADFAGRIAEGDRAVTDMDGSTYVVPVTYSGIGAIYRQDSLDQIGGEPPQTWSELLDLCGAARDNDMVLLALGNQTDWVTQLVTYALVATTVYAETPDFAAQMAAGDASFADSGWQEAMEKYLEMNEAGCFSDSPLGTSNEVAISQVAEGDAVGLVQVTATLSQVEAEAGEDAELGMFALPATDDAEETHMPGAVAASYGLGAEAENPEMGMRFIEFLGSPEGQEIYASEGGALPALPNEEFEPAPALQTLVDYQAEGRTVPFMDQLWPNPEVQQEHFTVIQQIFSDETTVADGLTAMDEAYAQE